MRQGHRSALRAPPQAFEIADDFVGRVASRQPCDTTAGMGPGTAQVKMRDGHAVVGMAKHGPGAEELVQRKLAMKDVAIQETEAAFQIQW